MLFSFKMFDASVRLTEGWRHTKWSKLTLPFWIRADNLIIQWMGYAVLTSKESAQRKRHVLEIPENNHVSAASLQLSFQCNSGLTRKLEKLRPDLPVIQN